jgi:hypothetical protein
MNMIKYVYYSLFGAWRLMRFDPKGLDWIDQTESGFWRSFLAALVGLPFFLALSGLERDLRGSQAFGIFAPLEKLDLDHYLLLQTLDYIAIWPIFAMVMILYSRWLKMSDRFVPLIVGYNWARCLSIVVPIPAYLMITLGLLNSFFALVLTMAASIFVLVPCGGYGGDGRYFTGGGCFGWHDRPVWPFFYRASIGQLNIPRSIIHPQ